MSASIRLFGVVCGLLDSPRTTLAAVLKIHRVLGCDTCLFRSDAVVDATLLPFFVCSIDRRSRIDSLFIDFVTFFVPVAYMFRVIYLSVCSQEAALVLVAQLRAFVMFLLCILLLLLHFRQTSVV